MGSAESRWQVRCSVAAFDGSPAPELRVVALDKDTSGENTLGKSVTDGQGRAWIGYNEASFRRSKSERRGPDVVVRVFDKDDHLLFESRPKRNAPRDFILNIRLPEPQFIVSGTVRYTGGKPAGGVTVVAYAKSMRTEEFIGEAKTDDGRYSIANSKEKFRLAEKGTADLRVAVVERIGKKQREIATSPVRFNAKPQETIDLYIPEPEIPQVSEYERLLASLAPVLGKVQLAELTDEDIDFLVGDTGEDRARILLMRLAAQLSRQLGDAGGSSAPDYRVGPRKGTGQSLPVDLLYGCFREGVPTTLQAFLAKETDALVGALKRAIDRNIVPTALSAWSKQLPAVLESLRADHALRPAPAGGAASLGDLLATLPKRLAAGKERVVAEILAAPGITDEAIVNGLKGASFTTKEIAAVRVTRALGELTSGHAGLVRTLQGLREDPEDASLRFLAAVTPARWLALVDEHQENSPIRLSPEILADRLERTVEARHPTAVLVSRIRSGHVQLGDPGLEEAASVLAANPELELRGRNARVLVKDLQDVKDKEALVKNFQKMQRAQKWSDGWREAGVLLNKGLDSSMSIVELGPEPFYEAVALEIPRDRAAAIYAEAERAQNTAIALLPAMIVPWTYGGFLNFYKGPDPDTDTDTYPELADYPSIQRLFGNLTTCECAHCESVLSPAAYLVDLLRFLDLPADMKSTVTPALETLLARRPDLADLELTCKNTSTEIPYIDLVLEVLENAIGLPLAIPAPFGFDPEADLALDPLPDRVTTALRTVLGRSAITVGERLRVERPAKQLLIGTFVDWLLTDGARHWVLRHYPQSITARYMDVIPKRLTVTDYATARNQLDQGLLPSTDWVIPAGGNPRNANLPLDGVPVVAQVEAGTKWKVTYTRSAQVEVVMDSANSTVILKSADGRRQLAASPCPKETARRVDKSLHNGQIVEPLRSMLPMLPTKGVLEGYTITHTSTKGGRSVWAISTNGDVTLSYTPEELLITSLTYQTSDAREDLLASPENRNPEAYDKLGAAAFPWSLPFNLWLEEVRTFLSRRGVPRLTLMEHCQPANRLKGQEFAREVLGLSMTEADLITGSDPRHGWDYWGLQQNNNRVVDRNDGQSVAAGVWTAVLRSSVSILLQQSGLSYKELLNVLQTQFVRAVDPSLKPSGDACNPSKMGLPGLKADHLDRIHRFTRLWRKLGVSAFELDQLIAADVEHPTTLSDAKLLRVANLLRLHELLGLSLADLAAWWGSLTVSYHDYTSTSRPEVRCVYERLFLNPLVVNPPDTDFALDAGRKEIASAGLTNPPTFASKVAVIAAVLGLTQPNLAALIDELVARQELDNPPTLKLASVVSLFRNVSLARALRLSIPDYLQLRHLVGTAVFASPASAIEFVEQVRLIQNSGFSIHALQYVLQYRLGDEPHREFPTRLASGMLADLRVALQAVRSEALDSADDPPSTLRKTLSRVGWYPQLVEEAVALFTAEDDRQSVIVPDDPDITIPPAIATFISYHRGDGRLSASPEMTSSQWTSFSTANSAAAAVVGAIATLKTKVDAFKNSLPAIAHRLQSLELPTFSARYDQTSVPAIAGALSDRCYFDSPSRTIKFVGWMNDADEAALAATVSNAIAHSIRTQSDAYSETSPLNGFVRDAAELRLLFAVDQTPASRLAQLMPRLVSHVSRKAAIETLSQALAVDQRIARELLLNRLVRATTLDALTAPEFVESDVRVTLTPAVFPQQFGALCKLHKAALVCRNLKLAEEELHWLPAPGPGRNFFNVLDLDDLPSADGDADAAYDEWQRLVQLLEIADRAHVGRALVSHLLLFTNLDPAALTTAQVDESAQIAFLASRMDSSVKDVTWATKEALLDWTAGDYQVEARVAEVIERLARLRTANAMQVAPEDVVAAMTELAMVWPADVLDAEKLANLLQLLSTVQRLGGKASDCFALAVDGAASATVSPPVTQRPGKDEALKARNLLRARYDSNDWPKQLKPISDELRHKQRDALVAYLIVNPPSNAIRKGHWTTSDDLYEHFLIDPQMSACRASSRIVHAVSAVQLFVQRCLMNIEEVSQPPIDAERWKWMKNYRVWEANRKVFLYPENWIEPELRDDKSELFRELEGQLQQSEFNDERAREVLKGYLKQLEDISNLAVVGMYMEGLSVDGEAQVRVHVVARTRNQPARFFYRRWLISKLANRWEPWESVALEGLKSDHVLPFVMRGDVYIAWPEITQLAAQPGLGDASAPGSKWRVRMAWIRRTSRGWTDRVVASDSFEHPWVYGKDENQTFTFRVRSGYGQDFTDIDCYGMERQGADEYSRPVLTPSESRRAGLLSANSPLISITVTGYVYASYGTIYRKLPNATVRVSFLLHGTPAQIETAETDIAHDQYWRMGIDGAPTYAILKDKSAITDANGHFSITLQLPAWRDSRDFGLGYYRKTVQDLNPTIEVSVTYPGKTSEPPGHSFSYKDPQSSEAYQDYSALDFAQTFLFSFDGAAPADDPGRRMTFVGVKRTRIVTGDDAELRDIIAGSISIPDLTLPYGSGFKLMQPPGSAVVLPDQTGTAVTVWTNVPGDAYWLLQAAPFDTPSADVATYRDARCGYFIRRQAADTDGPGAVDRFQIIANGHPRATALRRTLSTSGVPALYALGEQQWMEREAFSDSHKPGALVDAERSLTQIGIRFEPDDARSPYASYNTELFFHVPLLIASFLTSNQRFADAQQWLHLIFDPTTEETGSGTKRYWRYEPFRKHSDTRPVDELLKLLADPKVPASDVEKQQVTTQINTWLKNPFRPHAVASLRPRAYQFSVVFKYLDNLLAWGDSLYRQYTTESINEATQLYILAAKLLGPRPQSVPRSTRPEPLTYRRARDKWDKFANVWLELEAGLATGRNLDSLLNGPPPFDASAATAPRDRRFTAISTVSSVRLLYFCVPHNAKLLEYWDTLEERLFNIRHCRNIDGVEQAVPLFQPPIDPALLVRATAAGLDIATVLAEANGPLPHYRFAVLLQKAADLCNDVKSLGGALLSALEKRDAEALALLRSRQEIELLDLVTSVREAQIEEAKANIEALRQSEATAVARFSQYQRLLGKEGATVPDDFGADVEQTSAVTVAKANSSSDVTNLGLTQAELDQIGWSEAAVAYGVTAGAMNTTAGILYAIAQTKVGTPFLSTELGGLNLGAALNAVGSFFNTLERNATHQASRSATIGQHQRRQDEWVFQSRMAINEVKQIRRQIIAAQIRADIAEKELANHKKQLKNAQEADRFMREKYTNRELYQWMTTQLSSVYFRAYQLAFDVAKRAERAFRFELGLDDSNFIRYGYWDSLKKGLLAGEHLGHDLKRMDVAYLDQNRREFEITKHVSLLEQDPEALITLRETGRCEISIPEVLFDLDYPGHYLRRMKSVALSVPCVRGPYATVSCKLTLTKSSIRYKTTARPAYQLDATSESDERFRERFGPIQSIVTSSAQQDSGLFETNLRDERYLPFEGAGAISSWQLEMPSEYRAFDYDTISDVILHIRYTARDGGVALKDACVREMTESLNAIKQSSNAQDTGLVRLFSLRHEFPSEWHRLTSAEGDSGDRSVSISLTKDRFPALFMGEASQLNVHKVDVYLLPQDDVEDPSAVPFPRIFLPLEAAPNATEEEAALTDLEAIGRMPGKSFAAVYESTLPVAIPRADQPNPWRIEIGSSDRPVFRSDVRDVLLACRYRVS